MIVCHRPRQILAERKNDVLRRPSEVAEAKSPIHTYLLLVSKEQNRDGIIRVKIDVDYH